MTGHERRERIARYARGPEVLKAALIRVPPPGLKWRPGPGRWSAHEVICHAADSEVNGSARIRYLVAEHEPSIVNYDEARWAITLDYHAHPLEAALLVIEAVRANTVPLLERLPEPCWSRRGRHSRDGEYTAESWLEVYSEHLEKHARQIERNVAEWREAGPAAA